MNNDQPIGLVPTELLPAVLQRLVKEVAWENGNNVHSYDRCHNRHNRSVNRPYPDPEPIEPPKPKE